jgi:hypothetical protein
MIDAPAFFPGKKTGAWYMHPTVLLFFSWLVLLLLRALLLQFIFNRTLCRRMGGTITFSQSLSAILVVDLLIGGCMCTTW